MDRVMNSAIEYEAQDIDNYDSNNWIDPYTRVEQLLALYLSDKFFDQIILLYSGYKSLRNWKALGVNSNKGYRTINDLKDAVKLRDEIKLACISHGHMSVLFLTEASSGLINEFLDIGLYNRKGKQVLLGVGGQSDPLMEEQATAYKEILPLHMDEQKCACVFSHDADCFFQIREKGDVV